MSVYVMSDLHGCYDEFNAMLDQIQFSDYDQLWIDGDVIDRGKKPIALLQEIMAHENMHMIYGNHDLWLQKYVQLLIDCKKKPELLYYNRSSDLLTWLYYNGGAVTADQFLDLSYPECYDIAVYLEKVPMFAKPEILGKKFLIVHAGLGVNPSSSVIPEETSVHDLVWEHIGIDDNPYDDVTMIVGHMPTFLYGEQYEGKIIHGSKKSILHIDCGCVYGRSLSCLRLDDMKEFYVPSTYPYLPIRKKVQQ